MTPVLSVVGLKRGLVNEDWPAVYLGPTSYHRLIYLVRSASIRILLLDVAVVGVGTFWFDAADDTVDLKIMSERRRSWKLTSLAERKSL